VARSRKVVRLEQFSQMTSVLMSFDIGKPEKMFQKISSPRVIDQRAPETKP
jgi:hypothetical protein